MTAHMPRFHDFDDMKKGKEKKIVEYTFVLVNAVKACVLRLET